MPRTTNPTVGSTYAELYSGATSSGCTISAIGNTIELVQWDQPGDPPETLAGHLLHVEDEPMTWGLSATERLYVKSTLGGAVALTPESV